MSNAARRALWWVAMAALAIVLWAEWPDGQVFLRCNACGFEGGCKPSEAKEYEGSRCHECDDGRYMFCGQFVPHGSKLVA